MGTGGFNSAVGVDGIGASSPLSDIGGWCRGIDSSRGLFAKILLSEGSEEWDRELDLEDDDVDSCCTNNAGGWNDLR